MDRTYLLKSEERDAHELLYQKLQGLALLQPPSEILMKLLSDKMFVKPNPTAFFHIMHYLFCLLDPVEFKKRFYWPLVDKQTENYFRKATIDYINYINEKHNLKWPEMKTYMICTPGGMKLVTVLLDFVSFIIRMLTRQIERQLGIVSGDKKMEISNENLQRMSKQNEFIKEYASTYVNTIDNVMNSVRCKLTLIKERINDLSKQTRIDVEHFISDDFQSAFEAYNRKLFANESRKESEIIASLNDPLIGVRCSMDEFQAKEVASKISSDSIAKVLNINSNNCETNQSTGNLKKIVDMETLLNEFLRIHEPLLATLDQADAKEPIDSSIWKDLKSLAIDTEQMRSNLSEFLPVSTKDQATITTEEPETPNIGQNRSTPKKLADYKSANIDPNLMDKYVCTPPLKIDLDAVRQQSQPRITDFIENSLQEHFKSNVAISNSYMLPPPPPPPMTMGINPRKNINRSKQSQNSIIGYDPVKMLRSMYKNPPRRAGHNDSTLNATSNNQRQQQQQELNFTSDLSNPSFNVSTSSMIQSDTSTHHTPVRMKNEEIDFGDTSEILPPAPSSPFTPFNCNKDLTCIRRSELESEIKVQENARKLSALKKVQAAALNINNIRTSPMSRLNSMVVMDDRENKKIPTIELKDGVIEIADELVQAIINLENLKIDDREEENSSQVPPVCLNFYTEAFEDDEIECNELLANISDNVLKDVTL